MAAGRFDRLLRLRGTPLASGHLAAWHFADSLLHAGLPASLLAARPVAAASGSPAPMTIDAIP